MSSDPEDTGTSPLAAAAISSPEDVGVSSPPLPPSADHRTDRAGGFRRLLAASAWLFSAKSIALALSFLQVIVVARVLEPRAYGLLALITTYTGTVNQLLDSRAWETATAYLIRYKAEGDLPKASALAKLCFLIDGATAVVALLLVAMTAPWAAQWLFKDLALAPLLTIFAATLVANAPTGTSMVLLRVAGRFRSVAFQNAITAAIRLVAVVVAVITTGTLASIVWAYVVAAAASGGLMLWMGWRGARTLGLRSLPSVFKTPVGILRPDFRGIARFLAITNANGTLKLAHRFGDILLVGYALGPADAGFVRLARSFSDLMNVPVVPMNETSYPAFASLFREGRRRELRALVRRVTMSATLVGVIGAGLLIVLAGPLVRLTVGPQFEPAIVPLRLFAVGMAVAVATSIWHPLLLAIDRPGRSFAALLAGVGVQLAIVAGAIVPMGLAAAGIAYTACHVIWSVIVGYTVINLIRRDAD